MIKALVLIVGLILAIVVSQNLDVISLAPAPVIRTCVDELPEGNWMNPFKEYIKDNENRQREGRGEDGKWRPIDSPEGGQEICYGHKLQPGEPPIVLEDGTELNPPLTDQQCDRILEDDIQKHINRVLDPSGCFQKWLRKNYPNRCLTAEEIIMFTDYSYTGVLCQFPKFSKGVIQPDFELACREYKRYYTDPVRGRQPLKERNANFCCNFLADKGCDCGVSCEERRYDFP